MKNDDGAIRGEVRQAGFSRVVHGLYRPVTPQLSPADNRLADLRALRLIVPEDAVFTHVTAAWLLGWQLPRLPEQVPHFAAVRSDARPRRHGLICSRLSNEAQPVTANGFRVDAPTEILLRAARDLGELDLAILVDSALRAGDVTDDALRELLTSRRPGTLLLRRTLDSADPLAESGGETLLRRFHQAIGVATISQVDLHDDDGQFVGRADLLVKGTHHVHEYDGAGHRAPTTHRSDLRRERRLAATPYVRRGYTLDDLVNQPAATIHEIDRALGRRHDPARLKAWRRLLEDSFYSAAGRERVMNRWFRLGHSAHWSRSA